jgi:hypothetical protein
MKQPIFLGDLIELCIRDQHLKHQDNIKQFTAFLDEYVAKKSNLSVRHLARVRKTEDFPSKKTIDQLSEAVPKVGILDPLTICQRLLLDFISIQGDQEDLKNKIGGFKITIVAGWSVPQALVDDNIANVLANNINAGISYEFIYPPLYNHPSYLGNKKIHSEEEAEEFLREKLNDLFVKIHLKSEQLDSSDIGGMTKKRQAIERTKNRIKFISTYSKHQNDIVDAPNNFPRNIWDGLSESTQKAIHYDLSVKNSEKDNSLDKEKKNLETESVLFWLVMPSKYVVLYNLGEQHRTEDTKYGSFLVSGKIFRGSEAFESKGWFYMESSEYQEIEREYKFCRESWTEIVIDQAIIDKALG